MAIERVSFVYPTLMRPGMIAKGPYTPELFMPIVYSANTSYLLAITSGMLFKSLAIYTTQIDILHEGVSVIAETTSSGSTELVSAHDAKDGQCANIYTMFVGSVKFDKIGIYTVKVGIFRQENGQKVGDALHENSCEFYVNHIDGISN